MNRTRFEVNRRKAGTRQGALARSLRCSLCIPLEIRHVETRNKLARVKDFWDRYYLRAGQLLVNFFFFSSNIPRNLCECLLGPSFPAVSKVANWELDRTGYPNYGTRFTLTQSEFTCRLMVQSEANRMNAQNLAIVWGPNLMWPRHDSGDIALNMVHQNQIIEFLLLEFDLVFK